MARLTDRYAWVLHLLVLTLCAALAGRGATRVLASVLPQATDEPAPPRPTAEPAPPPERDVSRVVQRNIFCSTCAPPGPDPARAPEDNTGPAPTPLDLKLVATMVGVEGRPAHALVRRPSGRYELLGVGDPVSPGRRVLAVYERRVLLAQGSQEEELFMGRQVNRTVRARPATRRLPGPRKRPRSAAASLLPGVRSTGPRRWEIRRAVIQKLTVNPLLLRGSARVTPHVEGGRPAGFRIHRMPAGGIYQGLGLRNDDVIRAVNGHPLTSPDKALEAYTRLRKASRVVLAITRGDRKLSHEYVVR